MTCIKSLVVRMEHTVKTAQPQAQAPSSKLQASSFKLQASSNNNT